jgi:hypothetical protein
VAGPSVGWMRSVRWRCSEHRLSARESPWQDDTASARACMWGYTWQRGMRPLGVIDARTHVEHLVSEQSAAAHRHAGCYVAECGAVVLAASLTERGGAAARSVCGEPGWPGCGW